MSVLNDREKALEKIKKCLRLAKSSNEHEAAAALRQARKMMESLQLTDSDVLASEASEARAKAGAARKPVAWEARLVKVVADVLGCDVLFCGPSWNDSYFHGVRSGHWTFIGCGPSAQIAQHAFTVLQRRLKAARADYITGSLSRCGPASKRRRADDYCNGWVYAVRSKVEPLSISERDRSAITAYSERYQTGSLKTLDRSAGSRRVSSDLVKGLAEGRKVDLRQPIQGAQTQTAITGSAP